MNTKKQSDTAAPKAGLKDKTNSAQTKEIAMKILTPKIKPSLTMPIRKPDPRVSIVEWIYSSLLKLTMKGRAVWALMLVAASVVSGSAATELVVNGDFESGTTGWTWTSANGVNPVSSYASLYHSATHYLWLGGDNGTDTVYQTITIPANATVATLSFYYNINTSQTSGTPDTFSATIRNTSGNLLATVGNWSNLSGTSAGNYSVQTYNLLPYAGQTIRIYFVSACTLVGAKTTNFRVDDVSVQVTTSTVSAPIVSTSAADQITTTSARMNGTVNPNGAGTTVYFQYGLTTAYGNNTGSADAGSGTSTLSVQASPTGLAPNTTYHYQLVAYNSAGTRYGGDMQFSTLPVSCSYSLSSSSANPGSSSGSGSFGVFAGSGCSWTASSDATSWLHTSSSSSGNGTVNYTYDSNPSASSRTGHITVGGQTFTVMQSGTALRLSGVKIGVDPGHGGSETGAVGPTGLMEKSVNLITALALKKYLEAEGATVVITRTDDSTVSLPTRSALFVNNAVNLAISVHHNAGGSTLDTTMVFIYCDTSLATRGTLASDVVQRLGASTGIPISSTPASTADTLCKGHADWQTGLAGVGQANLHMVRVPETGGGIPSILAEVSFISNPAEETKLRDGDYLDKNGWAIYAGVADYFGFTPTPRNGTVDSLPPTISSLSVTPSAISLGSSFSINYNVSDTGGSGLARVELWLATIDGSSTDPSWAKIGTANVSGNGPISGTLTDTPTSAGTKWYGFHAVDNAGNYKDERQAGVGPIQVVVNSPCSYSLSSNGDTWPSAGASDAFNIVTQPGCAWTAVANVGWITGVTPSGTGTHGINYTVAANNSTSARTGTISVTGGQTFTVQQNGIICSQTLDSYSASVGPASASGSISVTSPGVCSWTAVPAVGWIHTTSGNTGNGIVSYTVDANPSTSVRSGTISVGDRTFTIDQLGVTRIVSLSGSLAFGSNPVGTTSFGTLTIYNIGNSALTVTGISYPSGFSGNWSSGIIAPGSSQNVTVSFSPSAATTYGGNIVVTCDATSGLTTIAASGTGSVTLTRIIVLSGDLAFGNVAVGSTSTRTLTLANTGNATLTVSGISYPSGFSGNWSSGTIPAGGSQGVTVTFSPTGVTSYGGTVTVTSDKSSGVNTSATSGAGISSPQNQLTSVTCTNGLFQFRLNGPVGSSYVIQVSSNLINWSSVLTNVIPSGGFRVIDLPFQANQAKLFYRALPLLSGPLVLQPGPVDGQDIWTTSYYSYATCAGAGIGGGQNTSQLRIGGWGDLYYSLVQFDLQGLPTNATSAVLYLFCNNLSGDGTPLFLDRITSPWDWKTSGTGCDHDRLWWADKPATSLWSATQLPTPKLSQWYAVDVTALYNAWQNGTYPNYGVQFRPVLNSNNNFDEFYSADYIGDPTLRPKLVITK